MGHDLEWVDREGLRCKLVCTILWASRPADDGRPRRTLRDSSLPCFNHLEHPMVQSPPDVQSAARADLERIQFLARHYNDFLGLRALPLAAFFVLAALATGSFLTGPAYTALLWLSPLILVVSAVVGLWAHSYYRRRFGRVVTPSGPLRTQAGHALLALGVLALALYLQWSGWERLVPFSPSWALFWMYGLGLSVARLPFVRHYALLSGLGLALALAPVGWLPGLEAHPFSREDMKWGGLTMGLLLFALAFLDHRFLSHALGEGSTRARPGNGVEVP